VRIIRRGGTSGGVAYPGHSAVDRVVDSLRFTMADGVHEAGKTLTLKP